MEDTAKKTKILFIITKSNFGGAQRYVFDLATNLPKDAFETTVAFGGEGELKERLQSVGVQTVTIGGLGRDISMLRELEVFRNMFRLIRNLRPDIIHLNSPKAGGLGALAASLHNAIASLEFIGNNLKSKSQDSKPRTKNYKLKTIFTAHGWTFKEKRGAFSKGAIKLLSWLTVFMCDITITVSRDDREKVRHFPFVQSKIKVVHNGIGTENFLEKSEARKQIEELAGIPFGDKRFWIGSIGELHKNKGFEYAIQAVKKVAEMETSSLSKNPALAYFIVGEGEEHKNLQTVISRDKLGNIVFLLGSQKQAARFIKAFDLFLLPSLKEGLPYVLLEAGLAGIPTIATNVGGVVEIIEDMKSGVIIKEKRPKEIADAITYLMEHTEKQREFGEKIQKTIGVEFALETMITKTIASYTELHSQRKTEQP